MEESIPWQEHAMRAAVLFVIVLLFQQLTRGELTLSVAILVAVGYVVMAELVRRITE